MRCACCAGALEDGKVKWRRRSRHTTKLEGTTSTSVQVLRGDVLPLRCFFLLISAALCLGAHQRCNSLLLNKQCKHVINLAGHAFHHHEKQSVPT